jgi:hypothetical protein
VAEQPVASLKGQSSLALVSAHLRTRSCTLYEMIMAYLRHEALSDVLGRAELLIVFIRGGEVSLNPLGMPDTSGTAILVTRRFYSVYATLVS